jgi:hypothetical protein
MADEGKRNREANPPVLEVVIKNLGIEQRSPFISSGDGRMKI